LSVPDLLKTGFKNVTEVIFGIVKTAAGINRAVPVNYAGGPQPAAD
jgi:hypothetical protein